jgi:hypothetical protein
MANNIDLNPLTTTTVVSGSAGGMLSPFITVVNNPLSLCFPDLTIIANTIVLAFIGASVGYFTKLIWDKITNSKTVKKKSINKD